MERSGGRSPPIHVHVAKNTPVHVHVKKKKKKIQETVGIPHAVEDRLSQRHSGMSGSLRGRQGNAKTRYKPRSQATFIPPPGKSSNRSMSWEGPSHRLEIVAPNINETRRSPLRIGDLSTSEEEEIRNKSKQYEYRINSLLEEVGTLKNEVNLEKSARSMKKKREQLNASRVLIEEQEDELLGYKSELDTTIRENEKLRYSMEKMKSEVEVSQSEVNQLGGERDVLIRKLLEVEIDAKSASEETLKHRDVIRRLKHAKTMSAADVSELSRQREILMQKLEGFEKTNRTLRKLLKENHLRAGEEERAVQQRDVLLRKLTETEAKLQDYSTQLSERDRQVETLITQVESDKDQARAFDELQKTMEVTRGHLQNQFRLKEAENNRLSVQMKELELELNQRVVESEHLQGLLASTRDKAGKNKDALKKATRIQKDRAQKNEEAVEIYSQKLQDNESDLAAMQTEFEIHKENYNKVYRDKSALETEVTDLRNLVHEMEASISSLDRGSTSMAIGDSLPSRIEARVHELKCLRVENERLKEDYDTLGNKLRGAEKALSSKTNQAQSEVNQLQSAVSQYENLIIEYKEQLQRYKKENEGLGDRLHHQEKETHKQMEKSTADNEKLKGRMQSRLTELESYPDLLKAAETRLQDAQDRILSYERRATDHTRLVAELTQKVDTQADQLEKLREKYHEAKEEGKHLSSKLSSTERKLEDGDGHNRELLGVVNKREEGIRNIQERLDDLREENNRLTQQLETALADARRQTDLQKEKALSKERTAQARIMDLESQLARSTATAQQLKRAKDEAERKFSSRLQDMRDRLEHANSTTRSMQNYVQFLKTTYSNVFHDADDSPYDSPRPY